jgi:hypothetical protein
MLAITGTGTLPTKKYVVSKSVTNHQDADSVFVAPEEFRVAHNRGQGESFEF